MVKRQEFENLCGKFRPSCDKHNSLVRHRQMRWEAHTQAANEKICFTVTAGLHNHLALFRGVSYLTTASDMSGVRCEYKAQTLCLDLDSTRHKESLLCGAPQTRCETHMEKTNPCASTAATCWTQYAHQPAPSGYSPFTVTMQLFGIWKCLNRQDTKEQMVTQDTSAVGDSEWEPGQWYHHNKVWTFTPSQRVDQTVFVSVEHFLLMQTSFHVLMITLMFIC